MIHSSLIFFPPFYLFILPTLPNSEGKGGGALSLAIRFDVICGKNGEHKYQIDDVDALAKSTRLFVHWSNGIEKFKWEGIRGGRDYRRCVCVLLLVCFVFPGIFFLRKKQKQPKRRLFLLWFVVTWEDGGRFLISKLGEEKKMHHVLRSHDVFSWVHWVGV